MNDTTGATSMGSASHIAGFTLRPLRPDDISVATGLLMLASATGVSHHLERQLAATAGERGYAFVAERDGAVVGSALLSSEPAFPGSVITLISVSESARKSGVASALADLLEERLVRETLPASCRLRDDLFEGRRFAERHGFTLRGHSVGWSIDLAALEETLETSAREARQAAGVRVRRADLPQEIGRVLECAARCMPGLPAEQQEADPEQGRDYFPGNAIVLLAESDKPGGERLALGLTAVAPQVDGHAWYTLFTGVDPAHRRTGIARALKTESFLQARRAGAQSVLTHNHDTNDAIIGLNTAFGMQPAPGYWELQRPVRG